MWALYIGFERIWCFARTTITLRKTAFSIKSFSRCLGLCFLVFLTIIS